MGDGGFRVCLEGGGSVFVYMQLSEDERARLTTPLNPSPQVTICLKGPTDIIADGERWLAVSEPGALRRSGGLGDILAGTMGVLVHWARLALPISDVEGHPGTELQAAGGAAAGAIGPEMESRDRALWACAAASFIARRASRRAFAEKRRSMTAPDAIGALRFV